MSFKRIDIERALAARGFFFVHEGSRHSIWQSPSGRTVQVPRHREINRMTCRNIARAGEIDWEEFEGEIR